MRKTIFWLHLITGLGAGVVILIMSLTGVLLMYQRQITAWADGARVEPAAARLTQEQLLAKFREVEEKPPGTITVSSDPRAAVSFAIGREKIVYLSPYTGAVVGEGSQKVRAFFQSMIEWHRWLAMSGDQRPIGKAITGACNLGFLFLVVSGFYLWWPRKWTAGALRAVVAFDFSLKGKARDWNWHNVAGFWSAVPLALLVFTATFFSYPWMNDWLYRAMGEEPPPKPAGPPAGRPSAASAKNEEQPWTGTGLDAHWAVAEKQVTGWRTIALRVPSSPGAPLNFTIDRGNGARPDLRAQLTVSARTGEIEKLETYGDHSPARKVRLWVRWIHTGEAGGFIGQTIAGLASAAGVLLVWTGFALAWRRFFKRKESAGA